MNEELLNDRELHFLLYEYLDTAALCQRSRYADHTPDVFDEVILTAKKIAIKYFANHNARGDENEPTFDGASVKLIPETQQAWDHFCEAGFLAAHHDAEDGGLQLPEVVLRVSLAYFNAANIATTAYPFLTIGAANLVRNFASQQDRERFLPPMLDGRFSGTMALTEPGQGSALADIKTHAKPMDDGTYRLFGNKMYISGGDHSLTENIVHMVLAKIDGAPTGVKGISLFICPKYLVNDDGSIGERNDVALAGLLHKMGYRNATSTVLNFGENDGAVAYLVGEPHRGLNYMFQMMNEARIGVAAGAAALAYQGFRYSLNYARERPQGRLPAVKDPDSKQVNIVEHADVRRMLLAQKVYAEGSLALCLYASALFEDTRTASTQEQRGEAQQLLDLIIPVVKSWPSRYGLAANDLAIQVLGGAGYIREYPVEQMYRDNRLNPIHEGTEGIQAIDLLGRKISANNAAALKLLLREIDSTVSEAGAYTQLQDECSALTQACVLFSSVTDTLAKSIATDTNAGLANATVYLDMFGKVLVGWIWLRQALTASKALAEAIVSKSITVEDRHFYLGKQQAMRYFYHWELPQIHHQANLLINNDDTTFSMRDEWF